MRTIYIYIDDLVLIILYVIIRTMREVSFFPKMFIPSYKVFVSLSMQNEEALS